MKRFVVHTNEAPQRKVKEMRALEFIIGMAIMVSVSIVALALCKVAGEADDQAERFFQELSQKDEE